MAQRRMFSQKIVGSDAFIEMPVSARELYFQLGMYADDDGFINPKKIVRMVGASDDDLKLLSAKRFVLPFENGVVVIKHWKINNLIRKDFYEPTIYIEQKNMLETKENKAYTECLQNVNNLSPQYSIGKVREGKNSIDNIILSEPSSELEIIPDLLKDKQEHIRIIGIFAKAKKINFQSLESQRSFIKRNIRSASNLKGYNTDDIIGTMKYLIDNSDFKWTLETVGKYIDEDLTNLNKKGQTVDLSKL